MLFKRSDAMQSQKHLPSQAPCPSWFWVGLPATDNKQGINLWCVVVSDDWGWGLHLSLAFMFSSEPAVRFSFRMMKTVCRGKVLRLQEWLMWLCVFVKLKKWEWSLNHLCNTWFRTFNVLKKESSAFPCPPSSGDSDNPQTLFLL